MFRATFKKEEKLSSRKKIENLFQKGTKIQGFPVGITFFYENAESASLPQVLFAVPKKLFSKAVDRNLLKRRMREAYRLNKNELSSFCIDKSINLSIGFIYHSKKIEAYQTVEKIIIKGLKELKNKLQ